MQRELGEPVEIVERLGTFEHVYETSEIAGVDTKHHVATAYRCRFERETLTLAGDDQHSELDLFRPPFGTHHPYVEQYLKLL